VTSTSYDTYRLLLFAANYWLRLIPNWRSTWGYSPIIPTSWKIGTLALWQLKRLCPPRACPFVFASYEAIDSGSPLCFHEMWSNTHRFFKINIADFYSKSLLYEGKLPHSRAFSFPIAARAGCTWPSWRTPWGRCVRECTWFCCTGSMLQFAVGFVITRSCRGGRSKIKTRWNQKWAAGPHKSKTTQRSKRQVRKLDPSELRWEHPQVKAQAEGGGAGKTTRAKARHKQNA